MHNHTEPETHTVTLVHRDIQIETHVLMYRHRHSDVHEYMHAIIFTYPAYRPTDKQTDKPTNTQTYKHRNI